MFEFVLRNPGGGRRGQHLRGISGFVFTPGRGVGRGRAASPRLGCHRGGVRGANANVQKPLRQPS